MEHVLSLSYGKDSLACLGAIEELGWPLDRIVHVELWATKTLPADLPPMVDFKAKADRIIKARYGIAVERVSSGKNYNDCFYTVYGSRSQKCGKIWGFPSILGNWCTSQLKTKALKKISNADSVSYIGIAADEPKRFHNLTEKKRSPLVEAGWDEAKCRKWCEDNDLLSPLYTTATRGGCWFCHNQTASQLRLLRKNYPEHWAMLMKWDEDSPRTFKTGGRTVHDFDRRFQMEDDGFIMPDETWRWEYLESDLVNYRLF